MKTTRLDLPISRAMLRNLQELLLRALAPRILQHRIRRGERRAP